MTSHIRIPMGGSCLDCDRYKREMARMESEIILLKETIIKLSIDDPTEIKEEVDEKEDPHLLDLTTETLNDAAELHYTPEMFMKGQKGIAEFIGNYIVKYRERYLCTDQVRDIFTYTEIDDPEVIKKDVKCKRLMDQVYPVLSKKIAKVYRKLANDSQDEGLDEGYDSEIEEIIASAIKGPSIRHEEIDTIYNIFMEIKKIKKNRQVVIKYLRELPSYTG